MGSYQILGRSAKVQDAYDVRILRPARQPVFFLLYCSNIFNKKNCSAYNGGRRRIQCLFLKEQV